MDHTKWEVSTSGKASAERTLNVICVRGYILGIEDALSDLAESEIYRDETFNTYKNKLEETLISANRTLNALLAKT